DCRKRGVEVRENVHQRCRQAANEIEHNKPRRSHAVLDVVTEDIERPHIADDVEPAAVEEHTCEERPEIIHREAHPNGPLGVGVTRRDDAKIIEELLKHRLGHHELENKDHAVSQYKCPRTKIIEELLKHRLGHHELENKDHAVNQYKCPRTEGGIFGRNGIAYRKNGLMT